MADFKRGKIKKPPKAFYIPARGLVRFFCRVFLNLRVKYINPVPKEGGMIILGSHPGLLDSLFMASAIKNREINFVTTERFFHQPFVGGLFRFFGVIPRLQFHPDPRSIANMIKTAKIGGAIGLFPAGQTSLYGRPGDIAPSIVRLLRKCNANVVALRLNGSFFTKSRFGRALPRRGRVDATVNHIFTPESLAAATDDEIYAAVWDSLYYDDFEWIKQTGVTFGGRNRAAGYEKILYYCPKCRSEEHMTSRGHEFFCQKCGNGAVVGKDMHLTPRSPRDAIFPDMKEWFLAQRELAWAQIDSVPAGLILQAETEAFLYRGTKMYFAGKGTLFIDSDAIGFSGQLNQKEASLAVRHINLPGTATEIGKYIELYHEDWGLIRFVPNNGGDVIKIKVAQEYLYAKAAAVEK